MAIRNRAKGSSRSTLDSSVADAVDAALVSAMKNLLAGGKAIGKSLRLRQACRTGRALSFIYRFRPAKKACRRTIECPMADHQSSLTACPAGRVGEDIRIANECPIRRGAVSTRHGFGIQLVPVACSACRGTRSPPERSQPPQPSRLPNGKSKLGQLNTARWRHAATSEWPDYWPYRLYGSALGQTTFPALAIGNRCVTRAER